MYIFTQLGLDIEDRWRRIDYDEAELPAIAADALRLANIPSKVDVWEVVEWALGEYELPRQRNHGEPTAAHALAEKEDRIRKAVIFDSLSN